MLYRVKVAGRTFEGCDPRTLAKRAVEAQREACRIRSKSLIISKLQICTKSMQNAENPDFSSH